MLSYYDALILAIAASLAGGLLVGVAAPIGLSTGVLAGSLVATVFLYEALFRNPPVPRGDPRVAATAIVWHALVAVLAMAVYVG